MQNTEQLIEDLKADAELMKKFYEILNKFCSLVIIKA